MRAVVLDGLRASGGFAEAARESLLAELERAGCAVETYTLREMEISSCHGCFGCWTKSLGNCMIDDQGRVVAAAVSRSDLVVFLSPVTFGGYSYQLKKAVDRLVSLIPPLFLRIEEETELELSSRHHPCLLGLGWMDDADEEAERLFRTLVERNAVLFHCPSHAAGVALASEGEEQLRARIRYLFAQVEGER